MTTRDAAAASAAIDLLSQVNARIREFRAIVLEVTAGRSDVATLLSQANEIESEITARAEEVETLIGENVPAHQWVGSMLRLMNPDGDWGEYVDLLGPAGLNPRGEWEPGAYAVRDVVTRAGSAWIALTPTTSVPGPGADDWSLLVAAGDQGPQGPHISLRISAGWIEWRVVGTTEWFQLLAVADLMSDANPDTIAARDTAVAAAETAATDRSVVEGIHATILGAPVTITASTYTLQASDSGKTLRCTAACVVTLPASLPSTFVAVLRRAGSGALSWVAGSGATATAYPAGTSVSAQGASVVVAVDTNVGGSAAAFVIEGAIS